MYDRSSTESAEFEKKYLEDRGIMAEDNRAHILWNKLNMSEVPLATYEKLRAWVQCTCVSHPT